MEDSYKIDDYDLEMNTLYTFYKSYHCVYFQCASFVVFLVVHDTWEQLGISGSTYSILLISSSMDNITVCDSIVWYQIVIFTLVVRILISMLNCTYCMRTWETINVELTTITISPQQINNINFIIGAYLECCIGTRVNTITHASTAKIF